MIAVLAENIAESGGSHRSEGEVKGIVYINKKIQYRIHATDRIDEGNGLIIVDLDLEEFAARITVFESGKVIVKSQDRNVEISLTKGELRCG